MAYQQHEKQRIFKEQEFEQIMKQIVKDKNIYIEKPTRRFFMELAHTFIEEVLDLPKHQKDPLTKENIGRQILLKFPEITRDDPNIQKLQKRQTEIDKEDLF